MKIKLHVGNLPFTATEDDVRELLERFGQVYSVHLVQDRKTGSSRGFAFATLEHEAAVTAMHDLDGELYGDRRLRVEEARPPQERDRPFGGGRRS